MSLEQTTNKSVPNLVWGVIVVILLATSILFGAGYFSIQKELEETKDIVKEQQINVKVISFTSLFIEKVLKAEGEVSFEDRLSLENSVRELEDEEILNLWQRFVDSETEDGAQAGVKDLLEILIAKISY